MASEAKHRLGIDLGGTKIAGILFDEQDRVIDQARIASPQGEYRETLDAICGLVRSLKQAVDNETSIGIGIPGSISPASGTVQNANSTWLNGKPLLEDLQTLLEQPVRIANDANCFTLSEAHDGAASSRNNVFGVIIGTGCGGGLIIGNRIVNGPRGICGEWGHTPLPWADIDEVPGPDCWCGQKGCMETWVSGPAVTADHQRSFGTRLVVEEIVELASGGDADCKTTLHRHATRLARGLASVVNIVDPDCIVLGGGLSAMPHLYEELPELMAPFIFSHDKRCEVIAPLHGPESGVRGAARLWLIPED